MNAPQAIIIEHTVANYADWKAAFDGHAPARKDAGFVAHHLNRGSDSPNDILAFMLYSDRSKVEQFLQSSDLKEAMSNAGVQGPPAVTFCSPIEDNAVWDRPLPAVIVRHKVADYDAWKKVYDSVDEFRKNSGIVGHAVNRAGEDGNTIIVYHQAETREDLEKFMTSPELKRAMADAGVLEAPRIDFVEGGVDAANY